MLSRLRRLGGRSGATSVIVLVVSALVAVGGLGTGVCVAAVGDGERVTTAADAVAHAVAGYLLTAPERADLSVALQAGHTACALPVPPGGDGEEVLCARLRTQAVAMAQRDGAEVLDLVVGPDPRDQAAVPGPGGVVVLVRAGVRRGFPFCRSTAPPASDAVPGLCWAVAWASARAAG